MAEDDEQKPAEPLSAHDAVRAAELAEERARIIRQSAWALALVWFAGPISCFLILATGVPGVIAAVVNLGTGVVLSFRMLFAMVAYLRRAGSDGWMVVLLVALALTCAMVAFFLFAIVMAMFQAMVHAVMVPVQGPAAGGG